MRNRIEVHLAASSNSRFGLVERDTVFHGGDLGAAAHVRTLSGVEAGTGWSFIRTVLRSLAGVVVDAIADLMQISLVPAGRVRMDNGSEFINSQEVKSGDARPLAVSQPAGKANDNGLAEQATYRRVRHLRARRKRGKSPLNSSR